MEGIICLPLQDQKTSRIWLLVNEEERLDQVMQQLNKLHDVQSVKRHGVDRAIFFKLEQLFSPSEE